MPPRIFLCTTALLLFMACPSFANELGTFDGNTYLSMEKETRRIFMRGFLFGSHTQSNLLSKILKGKREIFSIILS